MSEKLKLVSRVSAINWNRLDDYTMQRCGLASLQYALWGYMAYGMWCLPNECYAELVRQE